MINNRRKNTIRYDQVIPKATPPKVVMDFVVLPKVDHNNLLLRKCIIAMPRKVNEKDRGIIMIISNTIGNHKIREDMEIPINNPSPILSNIKNKGRRNVDKRMHE